MYVEVNQFEDNYGIHIRLLSLLTSQTLIVTQNSLNAQTTTRSSHSLQRYSMVSV